MLVPFVLPFQIALVTVLILAGATVLFFWRRGNRFRETVWLTALIGCAAILPLTLVAKSVLDPYRYRVFRYPTAAAVTDPYVVLPPSATNVTYDKRPTGHFARFTVTEPALMAWLQDLGNKGLPFEVPSSDDDQSLTQEEFQEYFGAYGWKYKADFKKHVGPHAPNGAGFDLWHSAQTDTAVMRAGYW